MISIRYIVTNGYVPITVTLLGTGLSNIHNTIPSEDTFDDIYEDTYTLQFVDNQGCTSYVSVSPATVVLNETNEPLYLKESNELITI